MKRVVVCIPAFNESKWICHTIHSLQVAYARLTPEQKSGCFVVVIVNQPVDCSREVAEDNRNSLEKLQRIDAENFPLSVLDYTNPGLAHGVGEARGIAMSYAIDRFEMQEDDFLVSLDADCRVGEDYLLSLFRKDLQACKGFTLGFEQPLDDPTTAYEAALYELYLRYMKWSLTKAKSSFDFYTIGSCLGTNVKNYALSGGFMKRPATEDYHFLNKLRKYGPIDYWPEIKVFPSSRRSNRVFLGTGHFLSTYRQQPQGELPLFVPSPASFQFLSLTLRSVDDYFQNESSLKEHLENNPVIYSFFVEHKVLTRLESLAKHSSDRKSFAKKALQVLDGLQTLRLLKAIDSHRATTSCLLAWVNDLLRTDEKIDDPVALLSAFRHKDLEWSRCCPF